MKVVATSDLHGYLPQFPSGDLLIIAGDMTIYGEKGEHLMFARWVDNLPFEHIVVIGGNHDKYLSHKNNPFKRAHYLLNSSIEINGVKIWGSPYTPTFQHWYFMKNRGPEIRKVWDSIPRDLDILVTHGPPYGILDESFRGQNCGCRDLLNSVLARPPKYHIFGHIHEGYGEQKIIGIPTKFLNCSYLDENYVPQHRFQTFEITGS